MDIKENHLEVKLQQSYATLNSFSKSTKKVWLVFHGYGMLSKYFIKKFSVLDPAENFIIAPQGLSKFYLEGFTGRVGACWMTKEDRLVEIDNQRKYIQSVIEQEGVTNFDGDICLFGFSQGVATACRFAEITDLNFSKLILWAGRFPEDVERSSWPDNLKITYVTGLQDPFLKEEMIPEQHETVKKITGLEARRIEFEGKHEILPEILMRL